MTARRFYAVLRVKAASTEDLLRLPERLPGYILVPLWTAVTDHDGTQHADVGGEFSIGLTDLGETSPEDACDLWRGGRRGWFPFLADVPDRSPPKHVEQPGVVDEARARLARLALALHPGNPKPTVELSADDVRALRGLVVAEMSRIAAPADDAAPARSRVTSEDSSEAGLSLIPTSPLDRIAKHLRVPANEAAIQEEITRIHTALGDRGRTTEAWFSRAAERLGLSGAPIAEVVEAIDLLVAGEGAAQQAQDGEDRRIVEEVSARLGVTPIDDNVIKALDAVIRRAAEADDGPPPAALPADLDARLSAYCTVAARLGARAGASLTPDDVVSELDEVLKRKQAYDDAADVLAEEAGAAPAVDPVRSFRDDLIDATADRIASVMTGLHVERLKTATGMLSRAVAADPEDDGLWGDSIDRATVGAARDIARRTGRGE